MESPPQSSTQLLSECLGTWIESRREIEESNAYYSSSFNPLKLIRINEITHSRILGDLLNSKGSHGQKYLFLNVFLDHLSIPNPMLGEWHVSVEEGRVDVMLWREEPACVIIIENKAKDAVDQSNQIYRYWHQQVFRRNPKLNYDDREVRRNYRLVYMPADESKRPEEQSLCRPDELKYADCPHARIPLDCELFSFATWTDLLRREALPKLRSSNQRLSAFLNFYAEHFTTMNTQQLEAVTNTFSSLEKWNAFWELQAVASDIELIKQWLSIGARVMRDFYERSPSKGWVAERWDNEYETRWYLEGLGRESIGIGFGWPEWELHLHFKGDRKFSLEKAMNVIKASEFEPLRIRFPDNEERGDNCFACNKSFNPYSLKRTQPHRKYDLAWHAAHNSDDFAGKMLELVRQITEDAQLTELILKLNQECLL